MKLDNLPGCVEAHIQVGDEQAAEYEDANEDDPPNVATRYIEAAAGSTFWINFNFGPGFYPANATVVSCYVDGNLARSLVCQQIHYGRQHECEGIKTIGSYGQPILERFVFSELQTSDGAVAASRIKELQNLGTIEVKLYAAVVQGEGPANMTTGEAFKSHIQKKAKDAVPEKGLKGRAISNTTALARGEPTRPDGRSLKTRYLNGGKPLATFRFKYRSRRDLQIENIIPRSPSPLPLEERDPQDLTAEEARELVRRLRAREHDNLKIKHETKKEKRSHQESIEVNSDDNGDGNDEDELTITDERRKRQRVVQDAEIEVIDLCDA